MLVLTGCASNARLPVSAGIGPDPGLPEPQNSLPPLVNIAEVARRTDDARPTPAEGLSVNAFAIGLDHPRWLYVLPNGDVLVAETNAPARKPRGIYDWAQQCLSE